MKNEVRIEYSARHVHLSQEHQDILFGKGYEMTPLKELSQTGQYACEEKVTVRGPEGEFECRVLGPCRPKTQVELAWSDGFRIGIPVPLRESGHHEGTPGCALIGPKGTVELVSGVINPRRHLHLSDEEAAERGLKKGDLISVYVPGEAPATFHDVIVRTHPTFRMNVHLDTDEANAVSLKTQGVIGLWEKQDGPRSGS